MRITDRYQSLIERTGAARPAERADKSGGVARARSFDQHLASVLDVNVSEQAQELASGSARLEELRASIQSGTYRIDAHAIARRLVGEDDVG